MIFAPTEQLCCTLQEKDTTVQQASNAALITEAFLRRQRTDNAFDLFYKAVLSSAQGLTNRPVLPRQCKLPCCLDDAAPPIQPATPVDLYCRKYFEVLDIVCEDIKRRFDQKDLKVVADMESLVLDSANGLTRVVPESVVALYCSKNLGKEHLAIHLRMFPDVIKHYNSNSGFASRR